MIPLDEQIRSAQKEAMAERLREMRRVAHDGQYARSAELMVNAMNEWGYSISIDSYRTLERGRMPNHLELLKICQFLETDPNCWLFGYCLNDINTDHHAPGNNFIETITDGFDEQTKAFVKDMASAAAAKIKEHNLKAIK